MNQEMVQQKAAPGRDRQAVRARAIEIGIDIAPVFLFTVVNSLTKNVGLAIGAAVTAGVAVVVARLIRRDKPWRSLAALAIVAAGGLSAGTSGSASGFFLPQILLAAAGVVVILGLTLLRLPPAGLVTTLMTGEGLGWRRCPPRLRAYQAASYVLVGMPLIGLMASVPFYLSNNATGLGVVDMLNPVANALVIVVAWRVYRRVLRGHRCGPACASR